jgi:hypothetical protein
MIESERDAICIGVMIGTLIGILIWFVIEIIEKG